MPMQLKVESDFAALFRQAQAEKSKVQVWLSGGQEFTGLVAGANVERVHLTQLNGREFYDVMVKLDAVVAVEVRAR